MQIQKSGFAVCFKHPTKPRVALFTRKSNFVYHMLKNLLPVSMQSSPCQTWVILGWFLGDCRVVIETLLRQKADNHRWFKRLYRIFPSDRLVLGTLPRHFSPWVHRTNRAAKILLFSDICKTRAIILAKIEKYLLFSCTYQKKVVSLRPEFPERYYIHTLYLWTK